MLQIKLNNKMRKPFKKNHMTFLESSKPSVQCPAISVLIHVELGSLSMLQSHRRAHTIQVVVTALKYPINILEASLFI